MKPWLIFLIAIAAAAVLFGLTAALSCAPPLQITNIKVVDDCGCTCLSWETNQEAVCKVTYCEDGFCYTSSLEPEYSTLHSYGVPVSRDITITAIGRDGQATSISLP